MSRQVQYVLVIEVEDNHKSAVCGKLPSLDEVFAMAGVSRVSLTTTVEKGPSDV